MTGHKLATVVHLVWWLLPLILLALVRAVLHAPVETLLFLGALFLLLRPVYLGTLIRLVVVAVAATDAATCVFLPVQAAVQWCYDVWMAAWEQVGDAPLMLRIAGWVGLALAGLIAWQLIAVCGQALATLLVVSVLKVAGWEASIRQHIRDASAQKIASRLSSSSRHRPTSSYPRYSLYLRPFSTANGLTISTFELSAGLTSSMVRVDLEMVLVSWFPQRRPLIAAGARGNPLSTADPRNGRREDPLEMQAPGAGKVSFPDSDWQDRVRMLARHAELIVVVPIYSENTFWELREMVRNNWLGKCLVVMPRDGRASNRNRAAWESMAQVLAPLGLSVPGFGRAGGFYRFRRGRLERIPGTSILHLPFMRTTAGFLLLPWIRRLLRTGAADAAPTSGPIGHRDNAPRGDVRVAVSAAPSQGSSLDIYVGGSPDNPA